jgi:hypothetical protein
VVDVVVVVVVVLELVVEVVVVVLVVEVVILAAQTVQALPGPIAMPPAAVQAAAS